jgi:mannose/fructose/N-acetylgalactosamine-specific phosphotransferase system component IIB
MGLHLHIDNRLIHGQVTITWCSFYGVNRIVVVNDKVAADPLQQAMLPQAARGLPTEVLSVKDAIEYLKSFEGKNESVFIIAKTSEDALALLKAGIKVETLNVGNQAPVPGTKPVMVFQWIAVTPEDVQTYKEIGTFGYKISSQRTPAERDYDLIEVLKKKRLID